MACPVINYGIPESGAQEFNVNSGREIFRCGIQCIKLFITNVSVEKSTVRFVCGDISDAGGDTFCLENFNISYRDRDLVNWIAKDGANSQLPNGYVINRVGACKDLNGVIYLYTDGRASVRAMMNIENLNPTTAQSMIGIVLRKAQNIGNDQTISTLEWILSDINTNVNPTDWQRASASFLGFGFSGKSGTTRTYRINFNWNNGRGQESSGYVVYDDTPTPQPLASIIQTLISR